jgi:hypothetical protein
MLPSVSRNQAALAPPAGDVEVLELDAALLELGDFLLDVLDLPERLARPGGAGIGRRVEKTGRAVAEFVDHAARGLLLRLEAERAFVELARARYVLRRDIGVQGRIL